MSPSEMKAQEVSLDTSLYTNTNTNFIASLEKWNRYLNQCLAIIAGLSMVTMMLLVVVNVIIRLFASPIVGITELVGWLAAVTSSLALGYTQIYRGHVEIDVLVERFPNKVRMFIQGLMTLISFIFFSFLSYHFVKFTFSTMDSGILSQTLGIVYFPVIFIVSIGFFALALSLLVDFLKICMVGDVK